MDMTPYLDALEGHGGRRDHPSRIRQRLLVLYLATADLASPTVGWSLYDGAGVDESLAGQDSEPPYPSVLAAMRDGWRVIQFPVLFPPDKDDPYTAAHFKYEYVLEQLT